MTQTYANYQNVQYIIINFHRDHRAQKYSPTHRHCLAASSAPFGVPFQKGPKPMQGLNFCCGLSCHYRHCVVFARTAGMLSIELDWADIPCHQIRLGFHRRQSMSVISRTNTHRRRVFPSVVTSDVGVAQEMLDSLRAACEQCRNAGTILLVSSRCFLCDDV